MQVASNGEGRVYEIDARHSGESFSSNAALSRELGKRAEVVVPFYSGVFTLIGLAIGCSVALAFNQGLFVCGSIVVLFLLIGTEFGKEKRLQLRWQQEMLR